jgi:F420-non-reducing hydrogenase small subunit
MGCRGCYGPLDGVADQGAKMLSAIASVVGVGSPHEDEVAMEQQLEKVMNTLADPAGTFYRFSMAHSLLQRARFDGSPVPSPSGNGDKKGEVQ